LINQLIDQLNNSITRLPNYPITRFHGFRGGAVKPYVALAIAVSLPGLSFDCAAARGPRHIDEVSAQVRRHRCRRSLARVFINVHTYPCVDFTTPRLRSSRAAAVWAIRRHHQASR
jgi:hypothetical protein